MLRPGTIGDTEDWQNFNSSLRGRDRKAGARHGYVLVWIPRFARSRTEIQNGKVIHICFIIHFPMSTVQLGSGAGHKDLSFEMSTVVSLVLLGVLLPCPLRARKSSLALAQGHTIPSKVSSSHLSKWASPWGNTQTMCMCLHTCSTVYTEMTGEFSLKEELWRSVFSSLWFYIVSPTVFMCV